MTRRSLASAFLLALALLVGLFGLAAAQQIVTATLQPSPGSTVSGTATVTVQGNAAPITVILSGLTPGTTYVAPLQAGTCATPSASAGRLNAVTADATGKAQLQASNVIGTAAGVITPLTPALVLDGNHIIAIVADKTVACGALPAATAGPTTLPAAGDPPFGTLVVLTGIVGLLSMLGGWRLRRR